MQNNAFQPYGPTYLVTALSPIQAPATNGLQATSYRIRNVAGAAAYITWSPNNPNTPNISAVAPTTGNPSANTLGMLATSIEVFVIPDKAWFLASAGTFEVTPGEGI